MVKVLFDTNILLDYLKGHAGSHRELALYKERDRAISIITQMEILVGVPAGAIEQDVRGFLKNFEIVQLSNEVAERAVELRRSKRLKLADAIIFASAQIGGRLFITRDTKDFPANDPGIRVPYKI